MLFPVTNDMPPITVFLSYAQLDDDGLGFVEAFRRDLEFLCFADHGRRVEIFHDRTSLGWGDEWRNGISDAIEGALVFLPLVTLTYFERPWCREELLQFYSSARTREVMDLLLPVVVLGHAGITGDSPDMAVRIIAALQQFDFRDAAIEGQGTPRWRSTMMRLAGSLVAAVERAERRLGPSPDGNRQRRGELMAEEAKRLARAAAELTRGLQAYLPELERASESVAGASAEQRRARMPDVAAMLAPSGTQLERHGLALEMAAVDLDGHLRAYYDLTMAHGSVAERARLRADLATMETAGTALHEMRDLCADFLDMLHPVETLSVPLRQALQPTRTGFRAVQSAIGIIDGWTVMGR